MIKLSFTRIKSLLLPTYALFFGLLLLPNTANATPTLEPVYRLYDPMAGLHLQTLDANEDSVLTSQVILDAKPIWQNETPTFEAFAPISGACTSGAEPIYRIYDNQDGDHLLTADSNEASVLVQNPVWSNEGIGFCAYATQVTGTVPVYRLYNSHSGEHFLTADQGEANGLNGTNNWRIETADNGGVAFYANPY